MYTLYCIQHWIVWTALLKIVESTSDRKLEKHPIQDIQTFSRKNLYMVSKWQYAYTTQDKMVNKISTGPTEKNTGLRPILVACHPLILIRSLD